MMLIFLPPEWLPRTAQQPFQGSIDFAGVATAQGVELCADPVRVGHGAAINSAQHRDASDEWVSPKSSERPFPLSGILATHEHERRSHLV
jgi:hypothetical protein